MNEKREQLHTVESGASRLRLHETREGLLHRSELPYSLDDTETIAHVRSTDVVASVSAEATNLVATSDTKAIDTPEKMRAWKRAGYLLSGSLWALFSLFIFALDWGVFFTVDGLFLDFVYATAGYLAYKQLKAATTGTAHACMKFTCTGKVIKDNMDLAIGYVKNVAKKIFGKKDKVCTDCPATA